LLPQIKATFGGFFHFILFSLIALSAKCFSISMFLLYYERFCIKFAYFSSHEKFFPIVIGTFYYTGFTGFGIRFL
jgi:hypothetical protein